MSDKAVIEILGHHRIDRFKAWLVGKCNQHLKTSSNKFGLGTHI
jgi:hypothetical protein